MKRLRTLGAVGAIAAIALTGCSAQAGGDSDFPDDDITYVVPYPAGSAPDSQARVIAQQLEDELGVSVVVENVEGGAGTIGLYEGSREDADGYTIILGTSSASIQQRAIDTPFTGWESLTPLARTNIGVNVLYSAPDKGWDTLEDFVAEAKARPGELKVGLPAAGSVQHISFLALMEAADIDVELVHFDAGQMVIPAVNGTVDASVSQPGIVQQYVEDGTLAYLGAFNEEVPDGLDVTPMIDFEYDVNPFPGWEGVFAPAGLPSDVDDVLTDAIEEAVASDAYQDFMAANFGLAAFAGGDEFDDIVAESDEIGAEIVDELGLGR